MALGLLGITEISDMHQMNGLKNIIGVALGVASIVYFINHGLIYWPVLPALLLGNIIGGYYGALHASKLPDNAIRFFAISVGVVMTVILFGKYY